MVFVSIDIVNNKLCKWGVGTALEPYDQPRQSVLPRHINGVSGDQDGFRIFRTGRLPQMGTHSGFLLPGGVEAIKERNLSKGILVSVSSMTGFARAEGATDTCTWGWEAKSVNGKGLDVRLRYPRGFDFIDAPARDRVTKRFKRGNVSLNLDINWTQARASVAVNEDVLAEILSAIPKIQDAVPGVRPPSVDGILALRGVLEQSDDEAGDAQNRALEAALMEGLDQLLDQLAEVRDDEGERMGGVLHDQLAVIENLSEEAGELAALQPDAIRKRLSDQVLLLVQDVAAIDPDRLAQEAAIVMTKADVREELDRLSAHIEAARDLLAQDGPVGRRLDFLCQEFNREANTLCSKSSDTDLTRVGLDLKAVIEQFREQVQNIE